MDGLRVCATIPELPLMAGLCCYGLKDYINAEAWAKITLGYSWVKQTPKITRVGPKSIRAYYESPYLLLHHIHNDQGHTAQAEWAKREAMRAIKARGRDAY